MKSQPKKSAPLADTKRALHEMMRKNGLAFPESPEDVDRLEAAVDDSRVPTPDVNAFMKFLRGESSAGSSQTSKVIPFETAAVSNDLAMAARNGGTISPEIRQRMNEHRAAAAEKTKKIPR